MTVHDQNTRREVKTFKLLDFEDERVEGLILTAGHA